jgi:transcriptional regulator with XRE-family HTH domain
MIATERHLRAARILAGLSQSELAKRSKIGIATVKRMESFGGLIGRRAPTLLRIEKALKEAGVVLTEDGVRLIPQSK